jgi:tryptophan-rich sensory protein
MLSNSCSRRPDGANGRGRGLSLLQLIGWIVLTGIAAALGAIASVHAAAFYAQLEQPGWAPPAWLFGPVWSVLYLMMAVAAWRVGGIDTPRAAPALLLYLAQLALNALWSWLFFAWHRGAPAFVCIVVLWLMIVATIVLFGRRERLAALLLCPYLAWVSFAGLLCLSIWQRNPALLG